VYTFLCLFVVLATSGRMPLTGGAAEDKEKSKAEAINLDFGYYCFILYHLMDNHLYG